MSCWESEDAASDDFVAELPDVASASVGMTNRLANSASAFANEASLSAEAVPTSARPRSFSEYPAAGKLFAAAAGVSCSAGVSAGGGGAKDCGVGGTAGVGVNPGGPRLKGSPAGAAGLMVGAEAATEAEAPFGF